MNTLHKRKPTWNINKLFFFGKTHTPECLIQRVVQINIGFTDGGSRNCRSILKVHVQVIKVFQSSDSLFRCFSNVKLDSKNNWFFFLFNLTLYSSNWRLYALERHAFSIVEDENFNSFSESSKDNQRKSFTLLYTALFLDLLWNKLRDLCWKFATLWVNEVRLSL